MRKYHSGGQFNCLCKWMKTQNFLGTGLFCHVLGSPEDLQENSYYCSWPQSHLDAVSVQQQNKRPEVDSRREQQIPTLQFLTCLMSKHTFFLPFLKPQSFFTFPRTSPRCGHSCGRQVSRTYIRSQHGKPPESLQKNCEMLSHTSAPPWHPSPFSRLLFPPKVSHVLGILIKAYGWDSVYDTCALPPYLPYLQQTVLTMILSPMDVAS